MEDNRLIYLFIYQTGYSLVQIEQAFNEPALHAVAKWTKIDHSGSRSHCKLADFVNITWVTAGMFLRFSLVVLCSHLTPEVSGSNPI